MNDTISPIAMLSDDRTRDVIEKQIDKNIYVEAGAGTGKTSSLVNRIVALVKHGVGIDRIVAITFTRAAASELRERIRARLEKMDYEAADEKARQALEKIDTAAFQTIDAFVLSLLRDWSLLAGLPPDVTIQDQAIERERFEEKWHDWMMRKLDENDRLSDLIARAVQLDMDRPVMKLKELAQHTKPEHLSIALPKPGADMAAMKIQLHQKSERLRSLLKECINPEDKLAIDIQETIDWYSRMTQSEEQLRAGLLSYRNKRTNTGVKGNWDDVGIRDEARATLREFQDLLPHAITSARLRVMWDMHRYAFRFNEELMEDRISEGSLTYSDAIILAIRLLERDDEARRQVQRRYRRVLVDEFQDTSPAQVQLIKLITAPAGQPHSSPGSLFVVGDPKQSIYRFRDADAASSQALRLELEADTQNGIVSTLTQNHRSLLPIIKWVNAVFGEWMDEDAELNSEDQRLAQAQWRALEPDSRFDDVAQFGHVYCFGEPLGDEDTKTRVNLPEVREKEAKQIARIASAVAAGALTVRDERRKEGVRPSMPGDLAIITSKRTSWYVYRKELQSAGVPHIAEGEGARFDPQEFRDILNCLSAIDDPTDQPATVGALRSIYFACSDTELQRWAQRGGKFSYLDPIPRGLEASSVAVAYEILRYYHHQRDTMSFPLLTEDLIRRCQVREKMLLQYDSESPLRRVDMVVELGRRFQDLGIDSIRESIGMLRHYRELMRDTREQPKSNRDSKSVRLMTIHYSKGLEFPIVLLADLGGQDGPLSGRVDIKAEITYGGVDNGRIAAKMDDFKSDGYDDMRAVENVASALERTRCYYVAATRARDTLIVSRYRKHGEAKSVAAKIELHGGFEEDICASIPDEWDDFSFAPLHPQAQTANIISELDARDRWSHNHEASLQNASARRTVNPSGIKENSDRYAPEEQEAEKPDEVESAVFDDVPQLRGRAATAIGSAVHAAIQLILETPAINVEEAATFEADAHGVSEDAGEVMKLTMATLRTPLLRKVISSAPEDIWIETPVAVPLPSVNGTSKIIEGRVDLIYRLDDGTLGIVDFKTDRSFNRSLDEMGDSYALQLGAYAYAVARATGETVSKAGLLFSRLALEHPEHAEYWVPDLATAVDRALQLADDQR